MVTYVFANAPTTAATLNANINNSTTTIVLSSGDGAKMPSPGAGQLAIIRIEDEYITYDTRSTDTLSNCVRGVDGSSAASHNAPAEVHNIGTKLWTDNLLQKTKDYGNYAPDHPPASPDSHNDEFDDDSIGGAWTQYGTPDTISESTYHGYLYLQDNDSTACGIREAFVPGANAFTVVAKVNGQLPTGFGNLLLRVETSGPADIAGVGIQNNNAGATRTRELNGATENNTTLGNNPNDTNWVYLAIRRDATSNYGLYLSYDGYLWITLRTFSNAGTVANLSVYMDSQGGGTTDATTLWDFVRVFTSQTGDIGGVP